MTDIAREMIADAAEVGIDNVHDMDVTLRGYAEGAADAILAALPEIIAGMVSTAEFSEMLEDLRERAEFMCSHCGHDTCTDAIAPQQAARVLLGAMPLIGVAVDAAHQQIDWCRNHQITLEPSHPSQLDGGTTCAEDIQDAWEAAHRAIAEQEGE